VRLNRQKLASELKEGAEITGVLFPVLFHGGSVALVYHLAPLL
jgi:hypothetical protein